MASVMNRLCPGASSRARRLIGAVGAVGVLLFAGCGGGGSDTPRGDVSGTVTYQGQPVTEGTVNFLSPETGRSASATLDAQGKFTVDGGVEAGSHVVTITPPFVEVPPGGDEPPPEPKEYANIPEKYRSDTTSDLTAEVKPGKNQFSFELE